MAPPGSSKPSSNRQQETLTSGHVTPIYEAADSKISSMNHSQMSQGSSEGHLDIDGDTMHENHG